MKKEDFVAALCGAYMAMRVAEAIVVGDRPGMISVEERADEAWAALRRLRNEGTA